MWLKSYTVGRRDHRIISLAKELRLRPAYVLGHLHSLRHDALEQQEDGDLRVWSPERVAHASDFPGDAAQWFRLLHAHGLLVNGLLSDWLDVAGAYLVSRHGKHPERLREIWGKHGATYGAVPAARAEIPEIPRVQPPNLISSAVQAVASKPSVDPLLGMPYTSDYLAFVKAYPHERGKKPGQALWSQLAPDAALMARIMAALEQHKRLKAWQDPQFVPNIDKWLSENRWEMDLRGQEFILPPSSTEIPKCGRKNCSIKQHKQRPSPLDGVTVCDQCWDVEQVEAEERRFP